MDQDVLFQNSVALLKELIETPSLSGNEAAAAALVRSNLQQAAIPYHEAMNNTWCFNKYWDDQKPVILLNSHIDTVKPVDGWTYDPFKATLEGDRLTGLGSNDAGGPLVSLLAVFKYFYPLQNLPFNLIFAATAEEESSGPNGMAFLVKQLEKVDFAIVGEPTQMKLAVAEKGLLVIDAVAKGKAGHAAREEGINSIYLAMSDIEKIKNHRFEKISPLLGPVKMTVTQIEAGFQHNVVPDTCRFVMDVRTNECYTNDEIIEIINALVGSELKARSTRLNSSGIDMKHPFVKKALQMNIDCYGSPTLSDQSLMTYQSVKIGPGDSARSHTANEYIELEEIRKGISIYIDLLSGLQL
ncbi:M20 family metallo-hydrolase [Roseimarinus sediminis]|jgi:acetylornithine deacetylase|uniref:M20 family metallo-hydrolase n=1 Tax=Roseimarinus sediminis TaxID=1610899 RepID=UPI003D1F2EA4